VLKIFCFKTCSFLTRHSSSCKCDRSNRDHLDGFSVAGALDLCKAGRRFGPPGNVLNAQDRDGGAPDVLKSRETLWAARQCSRCCAV